MTPLTAALVGMAVWTPALPDWPSARAVLRGECAWPDTWARLPAPPQLPPAERRRAPDTVALALAVAQAAVTQSGLDPTTLLAVFTSAQGDLPLIDQLCDTLAHNPDLLSPTRFVHSIHNAPAGVWSQVAHGAAGHTALSGHEHSFANALLEALVQATSEQRPVLLVGYDTVAQGALAEAVSTPAPLAVACVLQPQATCAALGQFTATLVPDTTAPTPCPARVSALDGCPMASALPLLAALAQGRSADFAWPLGPALGLHLRLDITP